MINMKRIWAVVVGAGIVICIAYTLRTDSFRLRGTKQTGLASFRTQDRERSLSIALLKKESKIGDGALKVLTPGRKEREFLSLFANLGKPPISADSAYLSFYVRVPRQTDDSSGGSKGQNKTAGTPLSGSNGNGWTLGKYSILRNSSIRQRTEHCGRRKTGNSVTQLAVHDREGKSPDA